MKKRLPEFERIGVRSLGGEDGRAFFGETISTDGLPAKWSGFATGR